MPSPNSSVSKPARFSAPELVSTAFIDSVLSDWDEYVKSEMDREWQSLVTASDWLYQEALTYLCYMVLENLCVERPLIAAFALIDHSHDLPEFECELVLIWSGATHLDPGDVVEDATVTRVSEFPLPSKSTFLNKEKVRSSFIARWAWMLSELADDLPKKEM